MLFLGLLLPPTPFFLLLLLILSQIRFVLLQKLLVKGGLDGLLGTSAKPRQIGDPSAESTVVGPHQSAAAVDQPEPTGQGVVVGEQPLHAQVLLHGDRLQVLPGCLLLDLLVLLPVLGVGGVIVGLLLRDIVLVVDLPVAALVGHPVGSDGGLKPLPSKVQQVFVLGQLHPQGLNCILAHFLLIGFVAGVHLLDQGL